MTRCFVYRLDAEVEVEELGTVSLDIAYGGMFYPLVGAEIESLLWHGPPKDAENDGRNAVIVSTGAIDAERPETWRSSIDRSPCGTGTSARLAVLHARGELGVGEPFRHESILDLAGGDRTSTLSGARFRDVRERIDRGRATGRTLVRRRRLPDRLRRNCDRTWTAPGHASRRVGLMAPADSSATAPPSRLRRPHLPALDGLRGVAILGVLLFHTGHLRGGFLGVDLFFALSGYLITDLLLREVERTGGVALIAFWGRRARRLLPALAAMLAVVTVLVWALEPADLVRTTLADGPWVQLNLVNWHLLAESASYWDRFGVARVFEHLWSIAVEEQFYLVWPLLILIVAAAARRRGSVEPQVAVLAGVASVVSLLLMITLLDPADPTRAYTGTDSRAFSLLLGAIVATAPVGDLLRRAVGRRAGPLLAALALALATTWVLVDGVDSIWLFRGGLFAHSVAAALLIGLCVEAPQALVPRMLAWRPLQWLGLISYSLYLWHWPVIVLLSPQLTGLGPWPWTAAVCVVSIGVAALSKYLVEDPLRYRAPWARGRTGSLAFAALMIALAALWLTLPAPAPTRIDLHKLGRSADQRAAPQLPRLRGRLGEADPHLHAS